MTEGLLKQLDADLTTIPPVISKGESGRDRVMRLCAHAFLRLWTRIALESGQRLSLSPSQFVLGTYEGQMKWNLSETVDYKGIAQLGIAGTSRRHHSLIAETYIVKGEERARWFFALEEEKVKNRPVFVNYLVYDVPLKEFDLSKAVAVLKQVFPQWLESVSTGDDKPLWNMCKEKLECVGI
ncbi:MAG: hypothetical protein ABIE25_04125 [Thermoplasmatota archaeon]|nr:hypothetical protein [Candidatus Thermoplasmatota archaeon]MBU1914094.1 hypothetical protein [Candidatus Thermoplasmatota archaeon]